MTAQSVRVVRRPAPDGIADSELVVPTGWVEVPAVEVPDGGQELLDRVSICRKRGVAELLDIADALNLDAGLVRYALTVLSPLVEVVPILPDSDTVQSDGADSESTVVIPQDPAVSRALKSAAELAAALPTARIETARLLFKVAAATRPLTVERAKAITRLGGDDFEDILDDLVVSGDLILTAEEGPRALTRIK